MSHKKLTDEYVDNEPDYMFVVKTNRCAFFVAQLEELGLQVKTYSGITLYLTFLAALRKEDSMVVVYFPDNLLDAYAEINEVECRLLDRG